MTLRLTSFEHRAQRAALPTIAGRISSNEGAPHFDEFLPRFPVVAGDYQPGSISGVGLLSAAPSATVGQSLNTPGMRARGRHVPRLASTLRRRPMPWQ